MIGEIYPFECEVRFCLSNQMNDFYYGFGRIVWARGFGGGGGDATYYYKILVKEVGVVDYGDIREGTCW